MLHQNPDQNKKILDLLTSLHIQPKKLSLYIEALTHPSYANDNHLDYNYEKLEFLGDAVINLAVADYLSTYNQQMSVGDISKIRILIVQSKSEVLAAQQLNLLDYMFLGKSLNDIDNPKKILEDGYESLMGAIFADQGYDIAKELIIKHLCQNSKIIQNFANLLDYKSKFQELMMKYNNHEIQYKTTKNADQSFTCKLYCNHICYGVGKGLQIKIAEQNAAKEACEKFSQ